MFDYSQTSFIRISREKRIFSCYRGFPIVKVQDTQVNSDKIQVVEVFFFSKLESFLN